LNSLSASTSKAADFLNNAAASAAAFFCHRNSGDEKVRGTIVRSRSFRRIRATNQCLQDVINPKKCLKQF
jgi:hypothetical protein